MRCANPLCQNESAYFRSGSLHCVDRNAVQSLSNSPDRQVVWLCRDCSSRWTIEGWRPAGQQFQPRRLTSAGPLPHEIQIPESTLSA
jgi:hypothetical protein